MNLQKTYPFPKRGHPTLPKFPPLRLTTRSRFHHLKYYSVLKKNSIRTQTTTQMNLEDIVGVCWVAFSCLWLFATLWTVACQAPLSMEFSRQEYWSVGSHSLLRGIFLTQAWNLGLLHCRQILYCLSHQRSMPMIYSWKYVPLNLLPLFCPCPQPSLLW